MINAMLKIPDLKTSEGYLVEHIEYRENFKGSTVLSGIIRSDKKYDDHYVSWDLEGKNPTIKKFGNLIIKGK